MIASRQASGQGVGVGAYGGRPVAGTWSARHDVTFERPCGRPTVSCVPWLSWDRIGVALLAAGALSPRRLRSARRAHLTSGRRARRRRKARNLVLWAVTEVDK